MLSESVDGKAERRGHRPGESDPPLFVDQVLGDAPEGFFENAQVDLSGPVEAVDRDKRQNFGRTEPATVREVPAEVIGQTEGKGVTRRG